jgi:hypothetical protein
MKPHNYNQLVFDKGTKNIQWRKERLFNKNCWKNWLAVCKKLKLGPCISSYTNINSKWIKNLNIRPESLNLVQERVGNILYCGINRYRQELSHWNPSSTATKR